MTLTIVRTTKTQISSITSGPRQSNFELLRILAMFLVLVVHSDFFSLGGPSLYDFHCNPLSSFTRTLFEAASIVCVNVFILISGWFGIKPTIKGLSSFIFQCLFFILSIYFILTLLGFNEITLKNFANLFLRYSLGWFILSYSALYILSPVLNAYIEKAPKRQFAYIIIAFYIFQSIWGWSGAAKFVVHGYSTFSFIGLYLLARYIRLYGSQKLTNFGGAFYGFSIVGFVLLYIISLRFKVPLKIIVSYANPFVIIGALGLLLFFSKIRIKNNKFINWVAKSSFAVYLLHNTDTVIVNDFFIPLIHYLYDSYSGVLCIIAICFVLIIIFVVAILLDQPRIWIWNIISKKLNRYSIMSMKF